MNTFGLKLGRAVLVLSLGIASAEAGETAVRRDIPHGPDEALAAAFNVTNALVVNEDNDHYFKYPSERMNAAGLRAYVDRLAQGHVTHVFFCASGQRASYASRAVEPIWAGLAEPDQNGRTNNIWCVNAKKLHDAGIDPYAVWIARCREKGVSSGLTFRINDVHYCFVPRYFRTSQFYRDHPDCRTSDNPTSDDWLSYTLDFAHAEVREQALAVIAEQLDRYDVDTFELDWMRFPRHLRPGHETEGARFLTEVVARTRRLADAAGARRGRRIALGVRVPSRPAAAQALGLDVASWVREGLVDLVVASCFFSSADFDIPVADWKRLLGDRVAFLPEIAEGWSAGPGLSRRYNDYATYLGAADILRTRGADGFYLFNLPYGPERVFESVCREGLGADALVRHGARYPVTYHDVATPWLDANIQFPCTVSPERPATLRLQAGDGVTGRAVRVRMEGDALPPTARVTLNGCVGTRETNDPKLALREQDRGSGHVGEPGGHAFAFPAGAAHAGTNVLTITSPQTAILRAAEVAFDNFVLISEP